MAIGRHPVRQLRRSRQIGAVFIRHGFGFAWNQLQPAVRTRFGRPPVLAERLPADALARHFRLALEELGPTFIKLGQVLSTHPDLLPPAYIEELARLQDAVPPSPWPEVRAVLTAELGRPPEELFVAIDPQALAVASLAEVHAATLTNGAAVVVKVQRANIQRTIEADLAILAELSLAAQHTPLGRIYDFPAIVDEFAATLHSELDYRREGRNAERLRRNFQDDARVHFPRVYWEYTTTRVLVLERIEGIKIDNIAALDAAGVDRRELVETAARVIVKQVLEDGFFHADPHPGNFMVLPGNTLAVMDFGMVGHVDEGLRLDLIRLYAASVEMNADAVVDQLIRMGAASEAVHRRGLRRDITGLLNKYRGMPLSEVRANTVISEIMPIAYRYRLQFPTDLWLLGKTLSMLEGIMLQIHPEFDMFAVSEPIVRRLTLRLLLPSRTWRRELIRRGSELADILNLLPRATSQVLRQAERGELFTLHIREAREFLQLLDRVATRLAISMLLAALIMGTSLLVPSTAGNPFARLLTVAGFVVAAVMGAWLVFSMWRSSRGPH